MPQPARWPGAGLLRVLTHLGALIPLGALLLDAATDGRSVNPVEDIQLRTGRYAMLMLLLALSATPVSRVLRTPQIRPLRKILGLYAFGYTVLHFFNFIGLDYAFDLSLVGDAILDKPFVIVGMATMLVLLALAITSTRGWQRRLGGKWAGLHRLVYLAIILDMAHFALQEKGDYFRPVVYGTIAAVLLLVRLKPIRRAASAVGIRLRIRGLTCPHSNH